MLLAPRILELLMLLEAPSSVQSLMDRTACRPHSVIMFVFHAAMTAPVCEEDWKVRKAISGFTSASCP
jgi:hypothetical protein